MDREFIAEWFHIADMDIATAEHLLTTMRPQPVEIICFLCQQSAEKNLKGYLTFIGTIEPPKTHDLSYLVTMCNKADERFEVIERACDTLTRYSVQPRYPKDTGITMAETLKALDYARQIRDFEPLAAVRKEVL